MNNWPEILAEGRLVPHFQPIVSTETMHVAAFEALGRLALGDQVLSLGPFFHPVPGEEHHPRLTKDVDRSIRREAIRQFVHADPDTRLFLNVRPSHMLDHLTSSEGTLPFTLQTCQELGLDPRRLVIELTEEAIRCDPQDLKVLIDLYRSHGCSIAVDDVGAEASNLDRVGFFEPDIIKIDALMLRRSRDERSFREVLRGVSKMAEGLGASLLFEGVETDQDLEQALRYGARFVQGWVFAPARAEFSAKSQFQDQLAPLLRQFGLGLGAQVDQVKRRVRQTTEALGNPPAPVEEGNQWVFPAGSLDKWSAFACRVFITDLAGFQVSANFELRASRWVPDGRVLGTSRAMRPYFPGTGDNRWSVSEVYFDVNDRTLMRTYSRPWGGLLLFVDVPEIENPTQKR